MSVIQTISALDASAAAAVQTEQNRRVGGQRVAAEDERQIGGGGERVDEQEPDDRSGRSGARAAPHPSRNGSIATTDARRSAWRWSGGFSIGPGDPLGFGEQRHGAPFDDERDRGSAEQHEQR